MNKFAKEFLKFTLRNGKRVTETVFDKKKLCKSCGGSISTGSNMKSHKNTKKCKTKSKIKNGKPLC